MPKTDDGLEALVFTAQGDMRQALNNLQSTFDGFGFVNADNVFKVRNIDMHTCIHLAIYGTLRRFLILAKMSRSTV